MKKVLMVICAVALAFGVYAGVKKVNDEAGNPPVGGSPTPATEVADGGFTTLGNPPVGG